MRVTYPKPFDIFYMLPPASARLHAVDDVIANIKRPERYLFYGLDYLIQSGQAVMDNIRDYRPPTFLTWQALRIYRVIIKMMGAYGGALEWVMPHRRSCALAKLLFVFSDRLMLPILALRMIGVLPQLPTVYLPMGLPEKFEQFRNRAWLPFYINELRKIDRIVCLSKAEADILKEKYGLDHVMFLRTGVDTDYFSPRQCTLDVDVLSIGADMFRDFDSLLRVAAGMPDISFRIITSCTIANQLSMIPCNVEVLKDCPMETIREHMAKSRFLALPVKNNTYSGATTVLLQAMAMGKAVIANPIGANRDGYPFEDGRNCIMVPPHNLPALAENIHLLKVDELKRTAIGDEARRVCVQELDIDLFHQRLFSIMEDVFTEKYHMILPSANKMPA